MTAKIEQVKAFNARRLIDYNRAVSVYRPGRGGFPSPAMYMYSTAAGTHRLRGHVVSWADGKASRYFPNIEEARIFARTV